MFNWLQVTYPDYTPDDRLYPVIVWFHSGDFSNGTAQQQPGHVLATQEVVVVSVNYRLGALGEPDELTLLYSMA